MTTKASTTVVKAPSKEERIKKRDLKLLNDLNAALQTEKHHGYFLTIMLFVTFFIVFLVWAYHSPLEEVSRGEGRIIPSSREQIVQSLDPGTIEAMYVKEGDLVEKDQILLKLDDTRSSAVLRESVAKVENLEALIARLRAEAYGTPLEFPANIPEELKARETAAYEARHKAMQEAVDGFKQSKAVLDREIGITRPMVQRGVVSQVELLRMQRQSSELHSQMLERENRYLTDANNELVKVESELAQARENMAMRADPVDRSQIRAPMKGIVKNIRINTIGGVVTAGQDILEIVPVDETLLVEAYIRPNDVAFISPGLPAVVKITAYDFAIYGGLDGEVTLISPDTLTDERMSRSELKLNNNAVYYRILVQTKDSVLTDRNGNPMPIIPGMVTTVDIKTGEKTVFEYLIKPITRMKQALRER
ncbi:MAG: HlyD family type I secretion periplasmic adaptor subunit [Alcaligenaceae bacterium]|nr:HlyD family type I secretion periplasmic adaptor subunit [Alcaligenaceae bacterium]